MLATGFHSVPKSSESETALFPRQKKSNPPPDFSSQKNDPHAIFIAFLCDNFSQISYFNIFPKILYYKYW